MKPYGTLAVISSSRKEGIEVELLYFSDNSKRTLFLPYSSQQDLQPWSNTKYVFVHGLLETADGILLLYSEDAGVYGCVAHLFSEGLHKNYEDFQKVKDSIEEFFQ